MVHCIEYITRYTVHSTLHGAWYTVHSTLHGTWYKVHSTLHGTWYTVKSILHGTRCTVHYTVHFTQYITRYTVDSTLHGTWYTVHSTLHSTRHKLIWILRLVTFCWAFSLNIWNVIPEYDLWPFNDWNMLQLYIVSIKWWRNNIWVHSSVFIRYSDTRLWIWPRQNSCC